MLDKLIHVSCIKNLMQVHYKFLVQENFTTDMSENKHECNKQ